MAVLHQQNYNSVYKIKHIYIDNVQKSNFNTKNGTLCL